MKKTLFLIMLLMISCSGKHFFVPDDTVREQMIPPEFLKEENSLKKIVIFPKKNSFCRYHYWFEHRWLRSQKYGCVRNGVLFAPGESDAGIFMVPETHGGLFNNNDIGFIQVMPNENMAGRVTKESRDIPDDEVFSISKSVDKERIWVSTNDGASSFGIYDRMSRNVTDWDTFDENGGGLTNNYLLFTTTPAVYKVVDAGNYRYFLTRNSVFVNDTVQNKWKKTFGYRDATVKSSHTETDKSYVERVIYKKIKDKDGKEKVKEKHYTIKVKTHHIFTHYDVNDSPYGPPGTAFYTGTSIGEMLVVSHSDGFSIYDPVANKWHNYSKPHTSARSYEQCTSHDRKFPDVCTNREIYYDTLHFYGNDDMPDISPSVIFSAADGILILGFFNSSDIGKGGLAVFDIKSNSYKVLLSDISVYDIEMSSEILYAATGNGVVKIEDGNIQFLSTESSYDIDFYNDQLWSAGKECIEMIPLSPPVTIQEPSQ